MSRDTNAPRINEEYITQVSEEIEGTVTENYFRISVEPRAVY